MSTPLDPLQAAADIFNFPSTSALRNAPLPTYGCHTSAPAPFHSLLLCFPLSLFEMQIYIGSSETHVCSIRSYVQLAERRACLQTHSTCVSYSNSLIFCMKCDLNVHCKMGPRCTPDVSGSTWTYTYQERAVCSCAASSPAHLFADIPE